MTGQLPSVGRGRIVSFSVLCAVCIAGALIYFLHSLGQSRHPVEPTQDNSRSTTTFLSDTATSRGNSFTANQRDKTFPSAPALSPKKNFDPSKATRQPQDETPPSKAPQTTPSLLFRITALGQTFGQVGYLDALTSDRPKAVPALRCERLHFAAGHGVCLNAERGMLVRYTAIVFDRNFQPRHHIPLSGMPSRVRVSPNGRHAAMTVFVSGHSYAASNFSTLTTFISLDDGKIIVDDMEKFTVLRDGQPFKALDFNFWGVTFALDGNRFYATLGTAGRTYLVEGDLSARKAIVIRAGIECPALSPDNTRVAFKKRTGGIMSPVSWRLSVLDLRTLQEWQLAETRSVDDQVEWLDNSAILYSLPAAESGTPATNTWTVPADGGGVPRLLVSNAYSPVVLGN